MEIDPTYHAIRTLSAYGGLQATTVDVQATWSKQQVIPELPGFTAASSYQSLGGSTTIHTAGNHLGGSYRYSIDMKNRSWLWNQITGYYNSQCCGVAFQFMSSSAPLLAQTSNRGFSVSFTLAGIGSFSSPFGAFGGR
jgi:hypothetical protein